MTTRVIIALILALAFAVLGFFIGRTKNRAHLQVQNSRINILLDSVAQLTKERNQIIIDRDSIVGLMTNSAHTKYTDYENNINSTPDSLQLGITQSIRAELDRHRNKANQ